MSETSRDLDQRGKSGRLFFPAHMILVPFDRLPCSELLSPGSGLDLTHPTSLVPRLSSSL